MVRRDDEPGRVRRAGSFQRSGIRREVVGEIRAFGVVRLADLPPTRRIVEPRLKALELLLRTHVQVEFQNGRSRFGEIFLERVDQLVAFGPDAFGHEVVHAYDQHVFVVRAVEDHDFAALRRGNVRAPQEVVRRLFARRLFKRVHARALRIEPAKDVGNGSVFAGGVEPLEHDQQRVLVAGVEQILEPAQLVDVVRHLIRGIVLARVRSGKARIDISQADVRSGFDAKMLAVVHCACVSLRTPR